MSGVQFYAREWTTPYQEVVCWRSLDKKDGRTNVNDGRKCLFVLKGRSFTPQFLHVSAQSLTYTTRIRDFRTLICNQSPRLLDMSSTENFERTAPKVIIPLWKPFVPSDTSVLPDL